MKPDVSGYEKALTWRSLLAIIFAVVVVQPAIMYLYLVSGWALPLSTWLVILLWSEFSRMMGRAMTKQEIFIIMAFEWTAISGAWVFLNPIKNIYFAQSGITESFGLMRFIPTWWAPTESIPELLSLRSFLHISWLVPMLVLLLAMGLEMVASIAIGYLCYQIYVVQEKLDFPSQSASARTVITIAERDPASLRVLMVSALIGVIYAIPSFLLPQISGGVGASPLQLLPRGWRDATYLIEGMVPGATLGIDTTLFTFISGFLIPIRVLALMLITTFAIYFVGNHFLIPQEYGGLGLWHEWKPGTPMLVALSRSQLYVWISVAIGFSLASAFIPLLLRPRMVANAFSPLIKRREGAEKPLMNLYLLLAMFFAATFASVGLVHLLVPGFPVWILLLFSVGLSFFSSFLSANAAGVTFGGMGVPYMRESIIYFSGYRGLDIWFANYITWGTSPQLALSQIGGLTWVAAPPTPGLPLIAEGGGLAGALKMADMVSCRKSEYLLAYVLVAILGWGMSFFYASLFWSAAPIPSSAYPYTVTGWVVEVMERSRWIEWLWSGILFKQLYILAGFAAGSAVAVTSALFKAFYAPIAIAAATLTPMPVVISQFIGGVVGLVLMRRLGRENWLRYRPLIVIGMILGDAVILTLSVSTTLISKAQWVMPY